MVVEKLMKNILWKFHGTGINWLDVSKAAT